MLTGGAGVLLQRASHRVMRWRNDNDKDRAEVASEGRCWAGGDEESVIVRTRLLGILRQRDHVFGQFLQSVKDARHRGGDRDSGKREVLFREFAGVPWQEAWEGYAVQSSAVGLRLHFSSNSTYAAASKTPSMQVDHGVSASTSTINDLADLYKILAFDNTR